MVYAIRMYQHVFIHLIITVHLMNKRYMIYIFYIFYIFYILYTLYIITTQCI